METYNINIRKAQEQDSEDIFWLLHSESINWDTEQINENINRLYVMTCENKLIGAAYCDLNESNSQFHWTAIHPLYPEKSLSSILHNSLTSIVSKRRSTGLAFST